MCNKEDRNGKACFNIGGNRPVGNREDRGVLMASGGRGFVFIVPVASEATVQLL